MTPIQFNALAKKAKDTAKKINHTVMQKFITMHKFLTVQKFMVMQKSIAMHKFIAKH